ncbi:SpoIIE family protein phosphatase [Hyphobacterium sp. CCMP332]|nr:SpoIIE family protein phosphatase [Hyphobacterium sp. CCMP332]
MKKTTIQRQIILNVILPVAGALSLIAVINYVNTNRLLTKASENKSELISTEIKNILEFQDFTTNIIEDNLNQEITITSKYLVEEVLKSTDNIESLSLDSIRKSLELNPELWDFYVINREGIIVNTTFDPDKGLNYFDFGPKFKEYLLERFKQNKLHTERLTFEKNSNRKRKYSYQPTLDGKFIVEIGVYSDDATTLLENFREQLSRIAEEQESIVAVDLFIGKENPISFTSEAKISDDHIHAYVNAIETKSKTKVIDSESNIVTEFIYLGRENTDLYKDAAIRIISDRSAQIAELRKELFILLLIFGITMAILLSIIVNRSQKITDPLKKLVVNVNRITEGNLNERAQVVGNNEITTLSEKFNLMLERLEESYNDLERKVIERTKEISQQKEEIEAQRDTLVQNNHHLEQAYHEIEEQKKRITDSIRYAQRIQRVILPPKEYVNNILPEAFIIYLPKDIVSGDFYWVTDNEDFINFAAVDCTGHGVPGAFMSLVGNNNLNSAIRNVEEIKPSLILESLNKGVTNVLRQREEDSEIKDGMDIALCSIDKNRNKLQFAGAYRPLYFVRKGALTEIKGDKNPIGGGELAQAKTFTNHEFELEKGDCVYIFSDGFTDQFGGPDGKKFMPKQLKKILSSVSKEPIDIQEKTIRKAFNDWKGDEEQLDDVLIIGLRIS